MGRGTTVLRFGDVTYRGRLPPSWMWAVGLASTPCGSHHWVTTCTRATRCPCTSAGQSRRARAGLSLASAVASSRYDQCASLGKKKPRSNEGATAPELCKISPANFGDLCKTEVQLLRILLPRAWVKLRARGRAGTPKTLWCPSSGRILVQEEQPDGAAAVGKVSSPTK
jgi:hypothetical protein